MRLIDADALDVGPVFDEDGNRIGYKYVTEDELANAPTVQAIPLSVIDEIKEEIEKIRSDNYMDYLIRHVCDKILKIIDEKVKEHIE